MPKKSRPGGPAGFTILECLVAVAVIAIGCLALLLMMTTARQTTARSNHLANASSLAESEIERLRALASLDFELFTEEMEKDPAGKSQDLDSWGNPRPDGEERERPWIYTRTTRYFDNEATPRIIQVEVAVAWKGPFRTNNVVYTAAMTKP